MSSIDDQLDTFSPEIRAEFERIRGIVRNLVPDAEEGVSYGMPAYLHRGKAFLALAVTRKFLSLYPYSGKTIAKLQGKLTGFETTSGSIHFSLAKPLPEALLRDIIATRLAEIG